MRLGKFGPAGTRGVATGIMKQLRIILVGLIVLVTGCDNSNEPALPRVRIGKEMNELYDPQRGEPQPISWAMMPGGGTSHVSSSRKYSIILELGSKDIDTIAAFVASETSDVLVMLVTYEDSGGEVCHLDTDGYTPYLELSRKTTNEQFRLYLEIHRGMRETYSVVDLPALAGLKAQDLALQEVESIPTWKDTRSAARADFSSTMGVPAVMRIQGNEKTLYTYRVRPR